MITFYLLFGIVYAAVIVSLSAGWKPFSKGSNQLEKYETVTIIVPFRNEETNLNRIFESIIGLEYRPVQVIFVNDKSEDKGKAILEQLIGQNQDLDIDFQLLENSGTGKKEAVLTALTNAFGNYIFTTDVDCTLPKYWIEILLNQLSKTNVKMTAGPVMCLGGKNFFDHFQQIEWASIVLVTQTGFELGNPIMCSAANMAYKKDAFSEIDPYKGNLKHLSGDDEFLLKKMIAKYGVDAVSYIPHNLVWTQAQKSWKDLISQRIRWVSKWKLHDSIFHSLISFGPWAIQVIFLLSFLLFFQGLVGYMVFAFLWISKFIVERKALSKVLLSFQINHGPLAYFLTSMIHPFYLFCIGIGSLFGKYEWKGRSSS
ncbi:glycosyltransferase [Shivajiella indica]|uniref:Glycosyltransferase n=1 Tax=Shivajiella indica TaxID=872115 RepID=A0ABW5BCU2_9BACT